MAETDLEEAIVNILGAGPGSWLAHNILGKLRDQGFRPSKNHKEFAEALERLVAAGRVRKIEIHGMFYVKG